ncbi:hypothetical protein PAECIP111802_03343 [Paenibacillus allorhizosphaerae]|uniref:Uncharacterized protein n=1 Tax=Paenibacillus allorhizosphaerae TaxID=2849866 RepID=A0ABM8VJ65_9BACL|nr:hypothetical protein PAECIP111802_03343 [Paenibacillus allorhizosphaerae]
MYNVREIAYFTLRTSKGRSTISLIKLNMRMFRSSDQDQKKTSSGSLLLIERHKEISDRLFRDIVEKWFCSVIQVMAKWHFNLCNGSVSFLKERRSSNET